MDDVKRTLIVNDLQSRIDNLQEKIATVRANLANVESDNVCYNTNNHTEVIKCSNCRSDIVPFNLDDDEPFVTDDNGNPTEINYCPHCGKMFIW